MRATNHLSNAAHMRPPASLGHPPPEEAEIQPASFVVRVWKQNGAAASQCRGWVEDVRSGRKTSFLGLDRLPGVIAKYIGLPIRGGGEGRNLLTRWLAHLSAYLAWATKTKRGKNTQDEITQELSEAALRSGEV
jgi:hypothetical protein